jgi:CIC family chloride channel protein
MKGNFITKLMIWRLRHLKERHFNLILSLIVGLGSGIMVVTLKNTVHFVKKLLTSEVIKEYHHYLFFLYPIIGLTIVYFIIKKVIKHPVGHGIPAVLYAFSRNKSKMPKDAWYTSLLTAPVTVGFGGSVGLEGPSVASNSGLGSRLAQALRLNFKTTTLLLGCGAAGAMSSIFNAPITAIVFALEVIMIDLSMSSLIPILTASVVAALTSRFILGDGILFPVQLKELFTFHQTPFYILLGIFSGLLSVYFNKVFWFIEEKFEQIKSPVYRLLIGGGILGVLIFFIPPLYGEGFETINDIIHGYYEKVVDSGPLLHFQHNEGIIILLLFIMILVKAMATSVTFGAGGVGGVFAPSLFVGAVGGFVLAKLINLTGVLYVPETNFALAGMAGVIAGILHAPLTGIFLIAEITGGYQMMLPLMIVVILSYLTSKYFIPYSIYTMQLAKSGDLVSHHKDKTVLTLIDLNNQIETNFCPVNVSDTLGKLVKTVAKSNRNVFPVVNKNNELQGVVLLDDIREIMFKPELYDKVFVSEVMIQPPAVIYLSDSMEDVMNKFNKTGAWNLPVLDEKNHYIGFISKSKLFNEYRKVLLEVTGE